MKCMKNKHAEEQTTHIHPCQMMTVIEVHNQLQDNEQMDEMIDIHMGKKQHIHIMQMIIFKMKYIIS